MLFTSDLIIASGVSWNMTLREGECTKGIMVVEAIDQSWPEMAEATVPAVTQRGKRRESKASTVKPDWSAEPDPVSRLKQLLCFWVADNMLHINNLHLPCSKATKAMCLSTPIKKTGLRENFGLEGGFASGLWLQRSPHSKEVLGLNPMGARLRAVQRLHVLPVSVSSVWLQSKDMHFGAGRIGV